MRRILIILLFFCSLIGPPLKESQAEFYGDLPTGLLQLEEKRHPYYLFVPPEYSPEKTWPLIVLFPDRLEDPKVVVRAWVDWAKENRFFVLVPTVYPREGTLSTEFVDQWLFSIKQEASERYRIDRSQILLVGFGFGAHYAAYLGLNYPDEFSMAALVQSELPGSFGKLMKLHSDLRRQISFYLAPDLQGEGFSRTEAWAQELEKKGYRTTLDPLASEEALTKIRERMIQWFRGEWEYREGRKERTSLTNGTDRR